MSDCGSIVVPCRKDFILFLASRHQFDELSKTFFDEKGYLIGYCGT